MNEREIYDSDSSSIPSEEVEEDDLLVDDSDEEEEKIKEPEKHETSTDIFTKQLTRI